jgi:hypothetical protein
VSAQQDPKKFKWSSGKKPLTPEEFGDKVLRFAAEKGKIPTKGDVATLGEARGWGVVFQVTLPDGKVKYQDRHGNEVKVDGTFVPSKKLSSSDERIYVREG